MATLTLERVDLDVADSPLVQKMIQLGLRPYSNQSIARWRKKMLLRHRMYCLQSLVMILMLTLLGLLGMGAAATLVVSFIWALLKSSVPAWLVRMPLPSGIAAGLIFYLLDVVYYRCAALHEQWCYVPIAYYNTELPVSVRLITLQLEPLDDSLDCSLRIEQWSNESLLFDRFLVAIDETTNNAYYLETWPAAV